MLSDKISTLKLPAPVSVASGMSVGQVIKVVQKHRIGCVLVCQDGRVIGMMTERDVLMKVIARDVKDDEPVDKFMTRDPRTLTPDRSIGETISLLNQEGLSYIPIVDSKTGEPIALFRVQDVIDFLAESFPEQVINLPPRPHQKIKTAEGA